MAAIALLLSRAADRVPVLFEGEQVLETVEPDAYSLLLGRLKGSDASSEESKVAKNQAFAPLLPETSAGAALAAAERIQGIA